MIIAFAIFITLILATWFLVLLFFALVAFHLWKKARAVQAATAGKTEVTSNGHNRNHPVNRR